MIKVKKTTPVMVNIGGEAAPHFVLCQRIDNHGQHTVGYRYFIPVGTGNYHEEIAEEKFEDYAGRM